MHEETKAQKSEVTLFLEQLVTGPQWGGVMPQMFSPGACPHFIPGDTRQPRKVGGEQGGHTEGWDSVFQHQSCPVATPEARASPRGRAAWSHCVCMPPVAPVQQAHFLSFPQRSFSLVSSFHLGGWLPRVDLSGKITWPGLLEVAERALFKPSVKGGK